MNAWDGLEIVGSLADDLKDEAAIPAGIQPRCRRSSRKIMNFVAVPINGNHEAGTTVDLIKTTPAIGSAPRDRSKRRYSTMVFFLVDSLKFLRRGVSGIAPRGFPKPSATSEPSRPQTSHPSRIDDGLHHRARLSPLGMHRHSGRTTSGWHLKLQRTRRDADDSVRRIYN